MKKAISVISGILFLFFISLPCLALSAEEFYDNFLGKWKDTIVKKDKLFIEDPSTKNLVKKTMVYGLEGFLFLEFNENNKCSSFIFIADIQDNRKEDILNNFNTLIKKLTQKDISYQKIENKTSAIYIWENETKEIRIRLDKETYKSSFTLYSAIKINYQQDPTFYEKTINKVHNILSKCKNWYLASNVMRNINEYLNEDLNDIYYNGTQFSLDVLSNKGLKIFEENKISQLDIQIGANNCYFDFGFIMSYEYSQYQNIFSGFSLGLTLKSDYSYRVRRSFSGYYKYIMGNGDNINFSYMYEDGQCFGSSFGLEFAIYKNLNIITLTRIELISINSDLFLSSSLNFGIGIFF